VLETNIRLVLPGQDLYVWVRQAEVKGADVSPDLLERACGTLRNRHGLAAVPLPGPSATLLVATNRPITPILLEDDSWEIEVVDAQQPSWLLRFGSADGPPLLPHLIERALEVRLATRADLWRFDSPRIWYEARPFATRDGIAAYRRFEISALAIDGEGIGVAVDVGTAFFTEESLAYFFDPSVPARERLRREAQFCELTRRQEGQKGTLLYDNGRSRMKCYFEGAPSGVTCATTGRIRFRGQSYDSLLDYYRAKYPDLAIDPDAPAARVSFQFLDRAQYVDATRVRVRVMNENVPKSLSQVDKIAPHTRRELIQQFWQRLGAKPLGVIAPGMHREFWQPRADRVTHLPMPTLIFGKGRRLESPSVYSAAAYKDHFRQRRQYLEQSGCYSTPPMMTRVVYCAYPDHLDEQAAHQLASDVAAAIAKSSGVCVSTSLIAYKDIPDAIAQLRAADKNGIVLFVLNSEPAAYHEVAFQLGEWRIKRVTERTLTHHYRQFVDGAWDRQANSMRLSLGRTRWRSFIGLCAFDALQLLDTVPFRVEQVGSYEAHLVIDVGHDRRHFALSLLIARPEGNSPTFRIVTHVEPKADHQHEQINARVLRDQIVELVQATLRRPCDPLASILVLRDGLLGQQEIQGIDQALVRLAQLGKVVTDARVDLVELRKDTLKGLRMWDVGGNGIISNPLEGTLVRLDTKTALMTATGAATLHQGTAEPILIVGNGRCTCVADAAHAAFTGAQLNWSNPTVAQRLHIALRRTDEELTARAAQEIRRLR
jgi:hypothetical protein